MKLALDRRNARVHRSVEEQRKRALGGSVASRKPQAAPNSAAVSTPRAVSRAPVPVLCPFCGKRHDDLSGHIETIHGPDKFIRWLLSR